MNALCLVLEGENIALLTIVKDYRDNLLSADLGPKPQKFYVRPF